MQNKSDEIPNRMARRKSRTRGSLVDAVITLVLEKDYEGLMTEEITELADVGRRTFYNHFDNKRDCVLAAVTERYGKYAMNVRKPLKENPPRDADDAVDHALVIATMAARMFLLIAGDPVTGKLICYPRILHEAVTYSQLSFIRANISDGLAAGRFRTTLPAESMESIRSWGFVGLVTASIERGSQHTDCAVWANFVLQSLGLDDTDAISVVKRVEIETTPLPIIAR